MGGGFECNKTLKTENARRDIWHIGDRINGDGVPKNLRYKTCNGGMSTGQGFGRVDGDK